MKDQGRIKNHVVFSRPTGKLCYHGLTHSSSLFQKYEELLLRGYLGTKLVLLLVPGEIDKDGYWNVRLSVSNDTIR